MCTRPDGPLSPPSPPRPPSCPRSPRLPSATVLQSSFFSVQVAPTQELGLPPHCLITASILDRACWSSSVRSGCLRLSSSISEISQGPNFHLGLPGIGIAFAPFPPGSPLFPGAPRPPFCPLVSKVNRLSPDTGPKTTKVRFPAGA